MLSNHTPFSDLELMDEYPTTIDVEIDGEIIKYSIESNLSTAISNYNNYTGSTNNFRNSTFWMYKQNRFDLTKVQLTYDLPSSLFRNKVIRGLSVYVSGDDLLTISKESEHMETSVGSAPQCRFYNLGIKVNL